MAGLPGTGKTTIATAIARRTGAAVLNKDVIRAALFSPTDIEFTTQQDDFVVEIMQQTASYLFKRHSKRIVIFDGRPFSQKVQLDSVIRFATGLGVPWKILECVCAEETARERLAAEEGVHIALNRELKLYQSLKSNFESITYEKDLIDTDNPISACLEQALRTISEGR